MSDSATTATNAVTKRPQPESLRKANEARKLAKAAKKDTMELDQEPTPISASVETLLIINVQIDDRSPVMKGNDAALRNGMFRSDVKDVHVNGYNVFAKEDKEKKVNVGLLRKVLPQVFETIGTANSQPLVVMASSREQLQTMLTMRIKKIGEKIESLVLPPTLAFPNNAPSAEEAGSAPHISGSNFISVDSWLAISESNTEVNETAIGVVCINCAVPKVIDPYETIRNYLKKSPLAEVMLLHTVTTDALVQHPSMFADITKLASEHSRVAYSFNQLNEETYLWAPVDEEQKAAFLPPNAILYFSRIKAKDSSKEKSKKE